MNVASAKSEELTDPEISGDGATDVAYEPPHLKPFPALLSLELSLAVHIPMHLIDMT